MDLTGFLGDDADDVTEEQRDLLERALPAVAALYPDEDLAAERGAAESGAAQYVLGDATLAGLGRVRQAARAAAREAMDVLTGAIVAAAVDGVSESEIARAAQVDRMTVRKVLGKR